MEDPPTGPASGPATRNGLVAGRAARIAAGIGLVAAIAVATYVATLPIRGSDGRSGPPSGGAVPTGSAGTGIAIGQAAPDFVGPDGAAPLLADLDGRPIHLADFAGRPLWIVFWATWCTPCQEEAADIRAAFHAHEGDHLAVLAVDVQEPAAAARAFAQAHDLDYVIGLDPTAAVKDLYRAQGLPWHVFVDGGGVVRSRYPGQLTAPLMAEQLAALIGH
jgi:cytochrome c biogenesis protein CcmG/thiol:disulfide interchange protein DsbE